MSSFIKRGKSTSCNGTAKCVYCEKQLTKYTGYCGWCSHWLCKDCVDKTKFKPNDIVWFLKLNQSLGKLEVICGSIKDYCFRYIKTYNIEYHISDGPFKRCNVYEDYIFATKDECIAYGNEIGEVASDLQIQDLNLMKKQGKIYKQISDFLKSPEAVQFGVTGIDVRVENGYVNAEWKFGKRDIGDIKE